MTIKLEEYSQKQSPRLRNGRGQKESQSKTTLFERLVDSQTDQMERDIINEKSFEELMSSPIKFNNKENTLRKPRGPYPGEEDHVKMKSLKDITNCQGISLKTSMHDSQVCKNSEFISLK